MAQQGTKPTFAPKFGLKRVGCHVVCLSQKPSQGVHMNFMWPLMLLHFHFCDVGGRKTCKVWNVIILWLFELYVYVFVQPMAFCFSKKLCEHMFMWGQRESKGGGRGSWFKSMFKAWKDKLVQGANVFGVHLLCYSIFKKFQLWNCKLQMVVVVLVLCFDLTNSL
jgi:hypothetical protein